MSDSSTAVEQLFAEGAQPTSNHERVPADKRKKRRRRILIAVGALVALLTIAGGVAFAVVSNTFNEIRRVAITQDPDLERPPVLEAAPGEQTPVNILLLGSDSREPMPSDASAESLRGFRSDAIMVAQISGDRKHVTVMSIMRDNWVAIQGVGEAKINAAVSYGGLPLAVNTVENFIGARIDHVALIDFESFKGLTNAVGGVTVSNDIAYTAQNGGGGYSFKKGQIELDGDQALSFVRERYAFSDGDYQRARNQQAYLKGLTQRVLSSETLSSPEKLLQTFQALKPYLVLDDGLTLQTTVDLGISMRDVRSDDIIFFTSPTVGTGVSADGQSIVIPDQEAMEKVRQAMQSGTLDAYGASATGK